VRLFEEIDSVGLYGFLIVNVNKYWGVRLIVL
jgi:hypothetical protein